MGNCCPKCGAMLIQRTTEGFPPAIIFTCKVCGYQKKRLWPGIVRKDGRPIEVRLGEEETREGDS